MNNKKLGFFGFSPQRKIITVLFLLLSVGAAVFIYAPMSISVGGGWRNIGAWFPMVYLFALFIITYNLHNLKKILRKFYKPLIIIFYTGMALFLAVFIIFCFLILSYTSNDIPENPDLIIVLGSQVRGDSTSNLLRYRLDTAVEAINKYPNALCIVSGGQGPDESFPEAVIMKKYLVNKGIAENRIFEEAKSSSSIENLMFSKQIIDENNLKHENIIIVTSNYHIPRAILIAKRIYPSDVNFYAVKVSSPFALSSSGIMREFFAFVKSYIYDRV